MDDPDAAGEASLGLMTVPAPWHTRYQALAGELSALAPGAPPVLVCSTVNLDEIFVMDADRLDRLVAAGEAAGGYAAQLVAGVRREVATGSDAELSWDWPEGPAWVGGVLGAPDRAQVGGTGPQAAWALGVLGARTVMALQCREREQVDVLPDGVLVCRAGSLVPVRDLVTTDGPARARHQVLEIPRGTVRGGVPLARSHRLILRFAPIALEVDPDFLSMQPALARQAGGGLLSGLNGLSASDTSSLRWTADVARCWRDAGTEPRHLELGDTLHPDELRERVLSLRGLFSSLGLSLFELQRIWGGPGDPARAALELAVGLGCQCVVVHADRWSMAVHRSAPALMVRRLMAGNLLASARAGATAPQVGLGPSPAATYAEDIPASEELVGGWRADCCPGPYLAHPAATIGLGDTFAAGLLLAGALEGRAGSGTV
jgi:ADP-dependent phosphofructokinase/glucokinase